MWYAAYGGRIDDVCSLLDAGADVNADLRRGSTALMRAAEYGRNDLVNLLLDRGANIDAKNEWDSTALMLAASNGCNDVVNLLLDRGANIDAKDDRGSTALMYAAGKGHNDTVNLLLDRGANIDAKTNRGSTALMEAAESGRNDVVNLLLDRGANIDANDDDGRTALDLAFSDGNSLTASILLTRRIREGGADSGDVKKLIDEAVKNAEVYAALKVRLESDPELVSAFIQAACRDFASTATFAVLLSMGVNADRVDSDGDTPLTLAAANENSALAEFLLKNGAEATLNLENKFGETALSFATSTSNARLATLLREKGATERKVDEDQYPLCGMTLKDLDDFLEAKGDVLEGKTTYDVQLIIKDMTFNCSYCDYIKRKTQANVFISHAWGFLFLDVVATMKTRLGSDPDVVFWFDVFSVNQHSTPGVNLPFSFWSTVFKGAIMIIGRVLMILCRYYSAPGAALSVAWLEPLPLVRCWCIFESYCAISSGCKFEVALSVKDRAEFEAALLLDKDLLDKIVGGIDVLKSTAQVEEDKRLILKSIEKYQGGADKINKKLRKSVKEAYGSVDAKGDAEEEAEVCSVLKRVARIQNKTTK